MLCSGDFCKEPNEDEAVEVRTSRVIVRASWWSATVAIVDAQQRQHSAPSVVLQVRRRTKRLLFLSAQRWGSEVQIEQPAPNKRWARTFRISNEPIRGLCRCPRTRDVSLHEMAERDLHSFLTLSLSRNRDLMCKNYSNLHLLVAAIIGQFVKMSKLVLGCCFESTRSYNTFRTVISVSSYLPLSRARKTVVFCLQVSFNGRCSFFFMFW